MSANTDTPDSHAVADSSPSPLFGLWIPVNQPPDHERIVIVYDPHHADRITTAEYHATWGDDGTWAQGKQQIEVSPAFWMPAPSEPNGKDMP